MTPPPASKPNVGKKPAAKKRAAPRKRAPAKKHPTPKKPAAKKPAAKKRAAPRKRAPAKTAAKAPPAKEHGPIRQGLEETLEALREQPLAAEKAFLREMADELDEQRTARDRNLTASLANVYAARLDELPKNEGGDDDPFARFAPVRNET